LQPFRKSTKPLDTPARSIAKRDADGQDHHDDEVREEGGVADVAEEGGNDETSGNEVGGVLDGGFGFPGGPIIFSLSGIIRSFFAS
jgi:hypothetical protein